MSEGEPPRVDDTVIMLRGVGHQLRQPAFALNLYATLLTSLHDTSDEVRDAAAGVLEVSEALHGLVNDVVELSEIGARVPQAQPTALGPLVRGRWEQVADPHRATLTINGLGEVDVDRELMGVVVHALVDNAVHHAGGPAARLTVSAEVDARGLSVTFQDGGPGIPEGERERVFAPFIRLNSRRPSRGMGLARALVAARRMGGELRCGESEGSGALFELRLPPGNGNVQDAPSPR